MEILNNIIIKALKATEVTNTEFEKHTLVNIDRYIAYKPRELSINTMNDLKKIRSIHIPNTNDSTTKSDLDIHIDIRYGLIEYHYIEGRLVTRIVLNSRILKRLDIVKLYQFIASEASKEMKPKVEFSNILNDKEQFLMFFKGMILKKIEGGPGTFDNVYAYTGLYIAKIMDNIDKNIDVLIAPRIVRELELDLLKSKETLNRLKALGIDDKDIEADNLKQIKDSEELLDKARKDMYKDITVEERYFKILMEV